MGLEVDSYRYAHLIFNRRVKVYQEKNPIQEMVLAGKTGQVPMEERNQAHISHPVQKLIQCGTNTLTPEMFKQLQKMMLKIFQNIDVGVLQDIATVVDK